MNAQYARQAVVAAFLGLLVRQVGAGDCAQWDASGRWGMIQSGRLDADIWVDLKQDGKVLTGKAEWWEYLDKGDWTSDPKKHYGSLDGTVDGDRFSAQITWTSERAAAIYTGQIGPGGRIEGETHDRARPKDRIPWYSSSLLKCSKG